VKREAEKVALMLHPEWNAMSDEQKTVLCEWWFQTFEVQELRLRRSHLAPASRGAFFCDKSATVLPSVCQTLATLRDSALLVCAASLHFAEEVPRAVIDMLILVAITIGQTRD